MELQKVNLQPQGDLSQENDKINLEAILALQMLKVGVREQNFPKGEGRAVLMNFMRKNFKEFTPEMINEAFDMALSGKLDLKETSCYENFSCEYLGRILYSYRSHLISSGRLKSSLDLDRQYKPIEPNLLPAAKMTDDELISFSIEMYTSSPRLMYILPESYDALIRLKKFSLTPEEKQDIMREAKKELSKMGKDDPTLFSRYLDYTNQHKILCKKIAFKRYLESL